MGLTFTRPEKSAAMERAAYAMRDTLAKEAQAGELNHAEAINSAAHVFTSILVGAYRTSKDREAVIQALPDLVRAYIPQWEKIYAAFERHQSVNVK